MQISREAYLLIAEVEISEACPRVAVASRPHVNPMAGRPSLHVIEAHIPGLNIREGQREGTFEKIGGMTDSRKVRGDTKEWCEPWFWWIRVGGTGAGKDEVYSIIYFTYVYWIIYIYICICVYIYVYVCIRTCRPATGG
jgi:hypothetical protein